jgi:hypothetical protein
MRMILSSILHENIYCGSSSRRVQLKLFEVMLVDVFCPPSMFQARPIRWLMRTISSSIYHESIYCGSSSGRVQLKLFEGMLVGVLYSSSMFQVRPVQWLTCVSWVDPLPGSHFFPKLASRVFQSKLRWFGQHYGHCACIWHVLKMIGSAVGPGYHFWGVLQCRRGRSKETIGRVRAEWACSKVSWPWARSQMVFVRTRLTDLSLDPFGDVSSLLPGSSLDGSGSKGEKGTAPRGTQGVSQVSLRPVQEWLNFLLAPPQ